MKNQGEPSDKHLREYLAELNILVGVTGRLIEVARSDVAPLWMVAYDSVPETGSTTAFTFGVSSIRHPAWKEGCVELVISVDSIDEDWPISLGAIASSLRGKCPFSYGNVLRFGRPMSRESIMSSFFIFWPVILEKEQHQLRLSDRTITLKQAYPIYDSEADAIAAIGAERLFMTEGLDFAVVSRERAY
jgi:hypothetical protein